VATLAADGSASYEFSLSWDPDPLTDIGTPAVIHTGSIAAFLEPGANVTSDILDRGRSAGAVITFDPNIRPSLVGDADAARARFADLAGACHVVKLSDEDAEFLFPDVPLYRVIDTLLAAGAIVVAITRGTDGAFVASGEHRAVVSPVATTVADTVGAGDSFMAALIWALVVDGPGWNGGPVESPRLQHIGETAARAAAITVSRPGADLPTLSELVAHVG
jgi:fructokinase